MCQGPVWESCVMDCVLRIFSAHPGLSFRAGGAVMNMGYPALKCASELDAINLFLKSQTVILQVVQFWIVGEGQSDASRKAYQIVNDPTYVTLKQRHFC